MSPRRFSSWRCKIFQLHYISGEQLSCSAAQHTRGAGHGSNNPIPAWRYKPELEALLVFRSGKIIIVFWKGNGCFLQMCWAAWRGAWVNILITSHYSIFCQTPFALLASEGNKKNLILTTETSYLLFSDISLEQWHSCCSSAQNIAACVGDTVSSDGGMWRSGYLLRSW